MCVRSPLIERTIYCSYGILQVRELVTVVLVLLYLSAGGLLNQHSLLPVSVLALYPVHISDEFLKL